MLKASGYFLNKMNLVIQLDKVRQVSVDISAGPETVVRAQGVMRL
jgi:hypothetical protein